MVHINMPCLNLGTCSVVCVWMCLNLGISSILKQNNAIQAFIDKSLDDVLPINLGSVLNIYTQNIFT